MRDDGAEELTGIVLAASPVGEYDRRVVLLTKESGKVPCFARRARRQGSPLMAAASPFAFGRFRVLRGKSSNVLLEADITNYFEKMRSDAAAAGYGMYFLEVCEYITRENNDEAALLALLYVSLLALEKDNIPDRLVRAVFEIRTIVAEGEFQDLSEKERSGMSTDAGRALNFIIMAPPGRLYTFAVSEQVLKELEQFAKMRCQQYFHHEFTSLRILNTLLT